MINDYRTLEKMPVGVIILKRSESKMEVEVISDKAYEELSKAKGWIECKGQILINAKSPFNKLYLPEIKDAKIKVW